MNRLSSAFFVHPVTAGQHILPNDPVIADSNGKAIQATGSSGHKGFLGFASEECDDSTSTGTKSVKVSRHGSEQDGTRFFVATFTGVAQTNLGAVVYWSSTTAVTTTQSTNAKAGIVSAILLDAAGVILTSNNVIVDTLTAAL